MQAHSAPASLDRQVRYAPYNDEGAFAKSVRAKANALLVLASAFFVLVGASILRPHLGMSSMMGEFKVSSLVDNIILLSRSPRCGRCRRAERPTSARS